MASFKLTTGSIGSFLYFVSIMVLSVRLNIQWSRDTGHTSIWNCINTFTTNQYNNISLRCNTLCFSIHDFCLCPPFLIILNIRHVASLLNMLKKHWFLSTQKTKAGMMKLHDMTWKSKKIYICCLIHRDIKKMNLVNAIVLCPKISNTPQKTIIMKDYITTWHLKSYKGFF